ncbi:MAG: hypothetical protein HY327_13855 [Chloroflexi bacterium]|nr:hypothetical protein [Chloroflexota bacterium]
MSWQVTNADTVLGDENLGIIGTSGSRPFTFNAPGRTIFTVRARCGNSAIAFKEVVVDVNPSLVLPPAAPAAPTNFSANGDGPKIIFNWSVASPMGYKLYREGSPSPTLINSASSGTSYSSPFDCDTDAKFFVRAVNSANVESPDSNHLRGFNKPCPPEIVSASGKAQGLVDIRFNDKSTNELGFRVYVTGGDASTRRTLTKRDGMPSGVDQTIGTYCNVNSTFYMTAYNDAGDSEPSNTDPVTTIPCAPTSFIADGSGTTITHRWAMTANHTAAGFQVYKVGSPHTKVGPVVSGTFTFRDDTGLFCNHSAAYFVRAVNSIGESENSNTDNAVTIPCAPTGFTASGISKTEVVFQFTDNATNEDGFHVYRDGSQVKDLAAKTGIGSMGGSVGGMSCNENHSYTVRAYNSAGPSTAPAAVSARTNAC